MSTPRLWCCLIGLIIFSVLLPASLDAAISPSERAALIALYNSAGGDHWTNNSGWKIPPLDADGFAMPGTEGSWYGITEISDHVTTIELPNNNLSGSIPAELGNCSNLQILLLYRNQLTGSIPAELKNCSNLQILYLDNNQLTGSIPVELGHCSNLKELSLISNQLTGSIPAELRNCSNLQQLFLVSNQLTGPVPAELGDCSNLTVLELNSNQLTGSIPAQLGDCSNLQYLFLNSNQLSGSIPISLTNLSSLQIGGIDIRWNALYTDNATLRAFLNSKHKYPGDWESTQTIAPTNITAGSATANSVTLTWSPILYTGDTGGYTVQYSTNSSGPWTTFGTTADKTMSSMTVTGLQSVTPYYFKVYTRTNSHSNNANIVISETSDPPVSCSTTNSPPTISDIGNRTILEDGTTGWIPFTINDVETNPNSLTLRATSNKHNVIKPENIVFGGSGSSRKLRITPEPNATGTVRIEIFVSDGFLEAADTFFVKVFYQNDAPVLTPFPDIAFDEDSTYKIDLDTLVSDVDHTNDQLTWLIEPLVNNATATPMDTTVIITGMGETEISIVVEINDTTHVATISGLPDSFGTWQLIFTVTDPKGGQDSDTCTVIINPVNDAPVFLTDIPPVTLTQGEHYAVPDTILSPFVKDVDNTFDELTWSVLPNEHITPVFADHLIDLTVPADWTGTTTVTVIVSDGELSDSLNIVVTVIEEADTTPPAVPKNLTATPQNEYIRIAWDMNTEPDIKAYAVIRTTDSTSVSDADILEDCCHPMHMLNDSTAEANVTYFYSVCAMDSSGNTSVLCPFVKAVLMETGVNNLANAPTRYELCQNYPNPFNPVTTIRYSIPKTEHVTIKVINGLGKEVTTLTDSPMNAGTYTLQWDGSSQPSGIYVVFIKAGSFTKQMKMVLMK